MEIRDYIKQGFETYYAKYSQVTEEGFCRWMRPDVPAEMKVVDTDEEWSIWKLVPSVWVRIILSDGRRVWIDFSGMV